jgi:hypothetical protein
MAEQKFDLLLAPLTAVAGTGMTLAALGALANLVSGTATIENVQGRNPQLAMLVGELASRLIGVANRLG